MTAAAGGFATSQASPDNTAGGTLIAAARPGRRSLKVVQLGTTDVFVGQKGLTTSTGALLVGTKGAVLDVDTQDAVFAITAGAAQPVAIVETY